MARVIVVPPGNEQHSTGNWQTARRYVRLLSESGHDASVDEQIPDDGCDLAFILHARRGADTIRALRGSTPIAIVLTGTDVYGDFDDPIIQETLSAADAIVALQADAAGRVPAAFQDRVHIIYQSAAPSGAWTPPADETLEVCVVANLRAVKDPLLPVHALASAPDRCRVTLIGGEIDADLAAAARSWAEREPRFRWLGALPPAETRMAMRTSHFVVIPSEVEGSSNVLMECLVDGVPVLATRIPGLLGTLGDDYPGLFEVGDADGLAGLLHEYGDDPASLLVAASRCAGRAEEARERASLEELVRSLC